VVGPPQKRGLVSEYTPRELQHPVTITLTLGQLLGVTARTASELRKLEKRRSRSNFVPAPGHHHAGDLAIERYSALLDLLHSAADRADEELDHASADRGAA